jgi:hypothetical protein
MTRKLEANVVYAAAVVQGIALVTFPAASAIFTDPADYDLSRAEYGAMFLSQALTAVAASLLGAQLGYGIAAFGAGPIQNAGVDLPALFGFTAIGAVAMGALSFVVRRRRDEPASFHPRPPVAVATSAVRT